MAVFFVTLVEEFHTVTELAEKTLLLLANSCLTLIGQLGTNRMSVKLEDYVHSCFKHLAIYAAMLHPQRSCSDKDDLC